MKPALLRHLLCPACGGTLSCTILQQKPVTLTATEQQILAQRQLDIAEYQTEVMTGHLDCARCNLASPIRDGVPRLYKGADRDWPLPTGGMPIVAWWPNLIIVFELTMLFALVATVITLLVTAGLPRRVPALYDPAVSDGRILVGVENPKLPTDALEAALAVGDREIKTIQ